MKKVVIIGAGFAGLSTAALLAQEGFKVTVLEKSGGPGGRARVREDRGFRFDSGPSWYLMPGVFDHFFELLGTKTEAEVDLKLLDLSYRVYSEPAGSNKAEAVDVLPGASKTRELFETLEPGSGGSFEAYLKSAKETTEMAEKYFLYNTFEKKSNLVNGDVLKRLPTLAKLLTTKLHSYIAKRFTNNTLRQILGYPAVFLGTDPHAAPAMYHLMSALDLDEGVKYPMGGFSKIFESIERLAGAKGVEIIYDARVTQIVTTDKTGHRAGKKFAVAGVKYVQNVATEETLIGADIVVSAADLHHTETQLLAGSERSYPERWWQKRVSGPGSVLVMLGVKDPLPELPHHTLFFTKNWHENFDSIFGKNKKIPDPASIYVCKPSATDDTVAPAGHENLFVLIPIPADPQLGGGGLDGAGDELIERAADAAIDQIATWAGIADLKDRIVTRRTIGPKDFQDDYNSWQGGMLGPAHILSQSAMFRAQNASKKVAGLYYAGATTAPGVGVPMCLISAELVLKHIKKDHSAGPIPVTSPAKHEK